MSGLASVTLLEPGDGSLGPLLRVTEDRLAPGAGYGRHVHTDVDVVAVVLAGSLTHGWGSDAALAAGDVGWLRAGAGLEHDEVAGPAGAVVVQTYLRAHAPGLPAAHDVLRAQGGWVDLGRPDARLWVGPGEPPEGLAVRTSTGAVLVWQLDTGRPAWAR